MSKLKESKSKRITTAVIALMMLFIMLFSVLFIAAEADHECTGDDCPICICIQQCKNTLHGFDSRISVRISFVTSCLFALFITVFFKTIYSHESPVFRKVRLNN
ncbi:MAG: hypothetical protein IKD99_05240 [Erysipelotrichaceae bacterium]|nr:hypothetical protein [Erysipelotrichaceae bacterium]